MAWRVRFVVQSVFAPITYHSHIHPPNLWPDDRYNDAICHLSHLFSRCIGRSIYLFLCNETQMNYSNLTSVLKISPSRYRCLQCLFIDQSPSPSPFLLSVLFVDYLQVCTPKAVCPFIWLCVQHGVTAPMRSTSSLSQTSSLFFLFFWFISLITVAPPTYLPLYRP